MEPTEKEALNLSLLSPEEDGKPLDVRPGRLVSEQPTPTSPYGDQQGNLNNGEAMLGEISHANIQNEMSINNVDRAISLLKITTDNDSSEMEVDDIVPPEEMAVKDGFKLPLPYLRHPDELAQMYKNSPLMSMTMSDSLSKFSIVGMAQNSPPATINQIISYLIYTAEQESNLGFRYCPIYILLNWIQELRSSDCGGYLTKDTITRLLDLLHGLLEEDEELEDDEELENSIYEAIDTLDMDQHSKSQPTFDGTQWDLVNRPGNLGDQLVPDTDHNLIPENSNVGVAKSPFFPSLLHSAELPQTSVPNPRIPQRLVRKLYKCSTLMIFNYFSLQEIKKMIENLTNLAENEYILHRWGLIAILVEWIEGLQMRCYRKYGVNVFKSKRLLCLLRRSLKALDFHKDLRVDEELKGDLKTTIRILKSRLKRLRRNVYH
ncbi:hypothetical protein FO519_004108 [Halicephalobus sp. NKZ332]|nr:hypothetical protein FO519_004108 [Halicephalobus sp. NKZ332]